MSSSDADDLSPSVEREPTTTTELPNPEPPMPEGEEPPPRGVKTMAMVRWAILVVIALVAAGMWISYAAAQLTTKSAATTATGSTPNAPKYRCPMHPQIVSDVPGECPICHMTLEPFTPERAPTPPPVSAPTASLPSMIPTASDAGSTYACPMHPEITAGGPGRCPICKMALEPLPADAGRVHPLPGNSTANAMTMTITPGSIPPGTTPIALALDRIQAVGVRTAVAEETTTVGTPLLHVTAVVQPPEQGVAEVHVRTPGFVEAIYVDQTGVGVRMGQSMLALYSSEILQAEHELLAMRAWNTNTNPNTNADAGVTHSTVTPNAVRKLELLGVTTPDIDRIVSKREPIRAIAVIAPRSGVITKKNVVLGSYVTPESVLYEIQDLSHVYVVADVFASDAPHVQVGSTARFIPSSHPEDRVATAKVDLVYPIVSAEARTRRVRIQIANPGSKTYTPGEYGTVELTTTGSARRGVTIPRDALVDTGRATYVFIVEDGGRFTPRLVTTSSGVAANDRVVVSAGLAPGERVVSGATFLIDSESRLQASLAQQSVPPNASASASGPPPAATPPSGSCDAQFDRAKYPEKVNECLKCEKVHRGMGTMEADCKNAIAKPWK